MKIEFEILRYAAVAEKALPVFVCACHVSDAWCRKRLVVKHSTVQIWQARVCRYQFMRVCTHCKVVLFRFQYSFEKRIDPSAAETAQAPSL